MLPVTCRELTGDECYR